MSDAMDAARSAILGALRAAVPAAVLEPVPSIDMPTLYVAAEQLLDVCRALRDDAALQFSLLAEVTAVDGHPARPRFEVVYHLASLGAAFAQAGQPVPPARRLRLKVRVAGEAPHLPSVTGIYPAAGWLEREVFDLFGIVFDGHPDLRRVLMPDDWEGYPLRKDYPVQIRRDTPAWSALQLSADEFAASIQAARDRARADVEQG